MKKRDFGIFCVVVSVLLTISLVSGFNQSSLEEPIEGELPSAVSRLLGNQRVNVYVDNNFLLSAETSSNKFYVTNLELEKPTLEILTDSETLNEIANSENPQDTALEAYNDGRIIIVKKTFMNKVRFFFANLFFRRQISGAVVRIINL